MRTWWLAPRSATIRSSRTWAMMLRAVFAWQTNRTVFTAGVGSPLLPRPLPEPDVAIDLRPFAGRTLAQLPAEVRARRQLEVGAEGLREQTRQLLGIQATIGFDPPHRLRLGEQRVAVSEGMEDLAVHPGGGVTGEVDDERRHVVGIALGADGLLARPLPGLLEHRPASGGGIDYAGGPARHDHVGRHAVLGERVRRGPRESDDARLGGGVVRLTGRPQRRHRGHVDDAAALLLAHDHGGGPAGVETPLQVDGYHRVPLRLRHVEEHAVAQDPRDVDEDVEPAPRLDGLIHHG